MADGGAAARARWCDVVRQTIILNEPVRNRIGLIGHRCVRVAYGGAADLACHRQIAFQQYGRHLQHVADIVEAVADVVGRQQLANVDLQRQQVANGVRVFCAIESMERRPSGIGSGLCYTIAFVLDRRDQLIIADFGWARHADGRHFAAAQLAQDLLPGLAIGIESGEVQRFQIQFRFGLGTEMASVAIDFRGLPKSLWIKCRAMGRSWFAPTLICPPTISLSRAKERHRSITNRLPPVLGFESCVAPPTCIRKEAYTTHALITSSGCRFGPDFLGKNDPQDRLVEDIEGTLAEPSRAGGRPCRIW